MIGGYRTFLVLVLTLAVSGHFTLQDTTATGRANPAPLSDDERNKAIAAFESSLLRLFGLSRRPGSANKGVKVPQYMIDLYRIKTNDYTTDIPTTLEARERAVHTSSTIRSFYHNNADHQHGCEDGQCARMWFNVSFIPRDEKLTSSELRVYVERNSSGDASNKDLRHKLEVYEIMRPVFRGREPISRLIDVQDVIVQNSTWMSLDVHPAVLKWKNKPRMNHGIEVRILPYNSQPSKAPLKHVRLRRSATGVEESDWHSQRPLLVTYSSDGKSRTKRSSNKRSRKRKNRKKNRKANKRRKGHRNLCRRRPLYVDFSEVGWNDWIVAPQGYPAYYCEGKCPFPLGDNLNTTNHAVVQTLVNSVDSRAAPEACCVPTTLSSISLLYIDDYGSTQLKEYDDMVVEGCGCR